MLACVPEQLPAPPKDGDLRPFEPRALGYFSITKTDFVQIKNIKEEQVLLDSCDLLTVAYVRE